VSDKERRGKIFFFFWWWWMTCLPKESFHSSVMVNRVMGRIIRWWRHHTVLLLQPIVIIILLVLFILLHVEVVAAQEQELQTNPSSSSSSTNRVTFSIIIESTRRQMQVHLVTTPTPPSPLQGNGSSSSSSSSSYDQQRWLTPTSLLLDSSLPLQASQVDLVPLCALYICHVLQPSPTKSFPSTRTDCSPLSPSPTIPTITWTQLEEAPGSYLLHSFLIPSSTLIAPIAVPLGPHYGNFPFTYQHALERRRPDPASSPDLAFALLYCQVMNIPQRLQGCAQKIVHQASHIAEERLLRVLQDQQGEEGAHDYIQQYRLEFGELLQSRRRMERRIDEKMLVGMRGKEGRKWEEEEEECTVEQEGVVAHPPPSCTAEERALLATIDVAPYRPTRVGNRLLCLTYTVEWQHANQVPIFRVGEWAS